MTNLEKVYEFLDEAKTFYFVTIDGDKPRARPISFKMLEEDKIWFGVGTFKDVYKQLEINPHIEVIASSKGKWMRYDGIAQFEDRKDLENKALDMLKGIGDLYRKNGWSLGMFYLTNAHVEIKAVADTIEEFDL